MSAQTDITVVIKGKADEMVSALGDVQAKMRGLATNMKTTFTSPVASIKLMSDAYNTAMESIKAKTQAVAQQIKSCLQVPINMAKAIDNSFGAPVQRMGAAFGRFTNGVIAKLNRIKAKIKETFNNKEVDKFTAMVQGGVFAGLVGGIGAVGTAAVKSAAQMEQTNIAFKNMLGSGEKAKDFLNDLKNFAAETPFEFPQVKDAAQKFLAFGFTAEQVIPTLTAVGDSAAALGMGEDGINRLTLALGQMAAKGKVSGEEMLQLSEAGVPAWQMLADKIGTSIPEAIDMVSKGAVDAQAGLEAIVAGMNSRFGGLMEQQSQTMVGLWSTIQDNVGQILVSLGEDIINTLDLKPILKNIGDFVTEFKQTMDKSGIREAIKKMVPPSAIAAVGALTGAIVVLGIAGFAALAAPIASAMAALAPFIAVAAAVGGIIALVCTHTEQASKVFTVLKNTFPGLVAAWNSIKNLGATLCDTFKILVDFIKPLVALVAVVLIGAFIAAANILGWFASIVVDAINVVVKIFNFFGEITNAIIYKFGELLMWLSENVLPGWASDGIKWISDFVNEAVGWFNDLIAKVKEVISWFKSLDGAEVTAEKTTEDKDGNKSTESKSVKANSKVPDFSNFKGGAPAGGGGAGGGGRAGGGGGRAGGQSKADQIKQKAEQISKSIEDEYMNTFKTKAELAERWYKKELEELDKSKSANVNYEQDKQRLTELYAKKRLDALREEAEKAREIQNSIRDLALELNTNTLNLNGGGVFEKMALEHEQAINGVKDKFDDLAAKYESMTAKEQEIFLKSLQDRGIAYQMDANNRISFAETMYKQLQALEKDYQDKRAEAMFQCSDIQQQIDQAMAQGRMDTLQEVLTNENVMQLNHYENMKQLMQDYLQAKKDAIFDFQQMMYDSMNAGIDSLKDGISGILQGTTSITQAFQKMGQTLLKTMADYVANWITSNMRLSLIQGMQRKKDTAQAIALTKAQIPAAQHLAQLTSIYSWGAAANAGAASFGSAMGTMSALSIPALATGGVATGATIAMIGEGKYREAVLPLNENTYGEIGEGIAKSGGGGSNITLNVSALDANSFGEWLRSTGGQVLRQFTLDNEREFTAGAGVW